MILEYEDLIDDNGFEVNPGYLAYEVDDARVIEAIIYILGNRVDTETVYNYVRNNFDRLFQDNYRDILDYFRAEAQDEYEENQVEAMKIHD